MSIEVAILVGLFVGICISWMLVVFFKDGHVQKIEYRNMTDEQHEHFEAAFKKIDEAFDEVRKIFR